MTLIHQHVNMTARARVYLAIASLRHLLVAIFAIFFAGSFRSPSFYPIISAAPLWMWGLIFLGAGLACGYGAATRNPWLARLGLMWSATSTLMVAVGLLLAWSSGHLTSPTGPIIWGAVALKDFTVCADPLRSPFEDLVEKLTHEGGDDRPGG